ncbi:hypothetical protein [Fibrisoma limi]|nr:hypothetical protein [Fibrisoma limi]
MELLVYLFYSYLTVGALFGLYFVGWGAARLDTEAHQMPSMLRILLWPASVALWPLLMRKLWYRQRL